MNHWNDVSRHVITLFFTLKLIIKFVYIDFTDTKFNYSNCITLFNESCSLTSLNSLNAFFAVKLCSNNQLKQHRRDGHRVSCCPHKLNLNQTNDQVNRPALITFQFTRFGVGFSGHLILFTETLHITMYIKVFGRKLISN